MAGLGLIPGLGRSPEGKGYPLQYSGLVYSMDYLWGCEELDMTEQLSLTHSISISYSSKNKESAKKKKKKKNSHELALFGNTVLPVHWAELVLLEMRS